MCKDPLMGLDQNVAGLDQAACEKNVDGKDFVGMSSDVKSKQPPESSEWQREFQRIMQVRLCMKHLDDVLEVDVRRKLQAEGLKSQDLAATLSMMRKNTCHSYYESQGLGEDVDPGYAFLDNLDALLATRNGYMGPNRDRRW